MVKSWKMRCVDPNGFEDSYTKGKVYVVKNGVVVDDKGYVHIAKNGVIVDYKGCVNADRGYESFHDWVNNNSASWELIDDRIDLDNFQEMVFEKVKKILGCDVTRKEVAQLSVKEIQNNMALIEALIENDCINSSYNSNELSGITKELGVVIANVGILCEQMGLSMEKEVIAKYIKSFDDPMMIVIFADYSLKNRSNIYNKYDLKNDYICIQELDLKTIGKILENQSKIDMVILDGPNKSRTKEQKDEILSAVEKFNCSIVYGVGWKNKEEQ